MFILLGGRERVGSLGGLGVWGKGSWRGWLIMVRVRIMGGRVGGRVDGEESRRREAGGGSTGPMEEGGEGAGDLGCAWLGLCDGVRPAGRNSEVCW